MHPHSLQYGVPPFPETPQAHILWLTRRSSAHLLRSYGSCDETYPNSFTVVRERCGMERMRESGGKKPDDWERALKRIQRSNRARIIALKIWRLALGILILYWLATPLLVDTLRDPCFELYHPVTAFIIKYLLGTIVLASLILVITLFPLAMDAGRVARPRRRKPPEKKKD